MIYAFLNAFGATTFIGLSLYLWRIGYELSDWAALALLPLAIFLYLGSLPLVMNPWKARLRVALRKESKLSRFLTGNIRSAVLSGIFVVVSIVLLAWQALAVSPLIALFLLCLIFISGRTFTWSESILAQHFHAPFARTFAVSMGTWLVAIPFTVIIATVTYTSEVYPAEMLTATFSEALQFGIDKLPTRRGLIMEPLSWLYAYDSAKLWLVLQFREYPIMGVIFSLDAGLFGFILARSSIILTYFVETHIRTDTA